MHPFSGYTIDLTFECRNLELTIPNHYQIILNLKDQNGIFFEYEKSQILMASQVSTLKFDKSIQCLFVFEKKQPIKIELIQIEKNIMMGQCQTTLGQIVGNKGSSLLLNLVDLHGKNIGLSLIKAEKTDKQSQYIHMDMQCWNKTTSFMTLHGLQPHSVEYRSDIQKENQNPLFQNIRVKFDELFHSDPFQSVKCQVFDYNSGKSPILIGGFEFSVYQVNDQKIKKFILLNHQKKNVGEVSFTKFLFDPSFLFYDYIRSGIELALIIAIDMTKSNKDPQLMESLHSIHPQSKNQYKEAIKAVSEILLNYDHDKMVPIFGFGGIPKMKNLTTKEALHCFPLNGDPYNPEVEGITGIIKTYEEAIQQIKFDGPTFLNLIIQQTMQLAQAEKDSNGDQYYILLILTDGVYHDKSSTKKSIVKCSHLPMSIIIIGIGNEDFTDMIELDGDLGLVDGSGNVAERDLVQFVPYNDFKGNPEELAEQVLEELPVQLVEYMGLIGRKPTQY